MSKIKLTEEEFYFSKRLIRKEKEKIEKVPEGPPVRIVKSYLF